MRPSGGARRLGPVRTPFHLVSLGDLSKLGLAPRVESLAVSVNPTEAVASIFVGTSDGQVLLFSLPLQGVVSNRATSPPAPSLSSPSTPQSMSSVTSLEEPPSPATLIASHRLGKAAVESLCELPAARQIAALCEGHVTLLMKRGLDGPVHMAAVQGGVLLARDMAPLGDGDDASWLSSMPGDTPEEAGEAARVALKAQRRKGLQRLFGAKQRVSDSRTTDVTSDDSRQDPVEVWKLQRLVVATRRKLLLFGVPTERDPDNPVVLLREILISDPVVGLAWFGPSMILGTRGGYVLLDLRKGGASSQLFSLPGDSPRPPLLKPLIKSDGAPAGELVLFADNLGIVVDAAGHPTGAPYHLKAPPDTIGHTRKYLLALAEGQLDVVLRKGGSIVQSLVLGGEKGTVLGPSIAADDLGGQCTVIASNSKLWWAQATPLEEQAKELLRQREVDEGVSLIEEAIPSSQDAAGCSLLATAHAEAAFIQFNELCFDAAVDHFLRSSAFEPLELFPFFPTYTARWRAVVPRKRYWGLHPPPQALKKVIENCLFQKQNGMGRLQLGPDLEPHTDPSTLINDAKRSVARYLAIVRTQRGPLPTRDEAASLRDISGSLRRGVSLLTANVRKGKAGRGGLATWSVAEAQGVDTLLVRLYADVSEVGALEALARGPHSCVLDEVEGPLRAAGRFHALALLLETGGEVARALAVWQTLVSGSVQEADACNGAVAEVKARASQEDSGTQGEPTHAAVLVKEAPEDPPMDLVDPGAESDFEGGRLLARVASLGTREFGSFRSSSFRSSVGSPRGTDGGLSPRRSCGLFSRGRGSGPRGQQLRSRLSGQAAVGAVNAARVLRRTSDMGLVLEHGRWLVRLDPELAMAVFTSDEREAPLPADAVLALLREEDAQIWRTYLHWVVEEQGTQDGRLHTELAIALAQAALDSMAGTERNAAERKDVDRSAYERDGKKSQADWVTAGGAGEEWSAEEERKRSRAEGIGRSVSKEGFSRHGVTEDTETSISGVHSNHDEATGSRGGARPRVSRRGPPLERFSGDVRGDGVTSAGRELPGASGPLKKPIDGVGTISDVRWQLQAFLDESDQYDTAGVLEKIRGSALWREQVILYRRAGDHVAALRVLALKLGDVEGAERYCAHYGGSESYKNLLEMYLHPGDGRPPMHAAAVRLLHCHGASLDPLKVLEALPSDMPLAAAADTIARLLRERVHRHRQGQVVHQLTRKLNFDARLSRVAERVRCVELNDERACWACHARIGTKLCALYPNDVLVCYKCLRKAGEHVCPVTGTGFRLVANGR